MPASCSASSKSVSRAFVRQRIATSSSGVSSARIASTIASASAAGDANAAHDRLSAGVARRAQHLLRSAELGDEPVREREHLRRRAVVLLEPHDGRLREARRDAEEVLRPGPGERVDRLVVVTDDTEIVAVAEPVLEQALLQQVDVLILVDGERAVLRAEGRHDLLVVLEETDSALEQVLEVEKAVGFLATLVLDDRRAPSGRRESADRDRPRHPGTAPARCGDSSPTRSRWRGRRPVGTCTARAACCRSGEATAPSTAGFGRPRRARSDAAVAALRSGTCPRGRE